MQHERPLANLPAYLAAARARGRPTRLVLRNTDRVGLVHLYFYQGQLVLVEGHRGAGVASLADLGTWHSGTIRQDDLDAPPAAGEADPRLEAALAEALRQLEVNRVVSRPSPPTSDPRAASRSSLPRLPVARAGGPLAAGSQPSASSPLPVQPARRSGDVGVPGLPPLPPQPLSDALTERAPIPPPPAASNLIAEPQWQLLVRFVHEIVEHVSQQVASGVAIGMLMQAVSRLSASYPFIAGLEVNEQGWLHPRREGLIAGFSLQEVTGATAALIGEYESRCALVLGAAQAHQVIADAAAPVWGTLTSLGLVLQ
jgi:hypothetical protein